MDKILLSFTALIILGIQYVNSQELIKNYELGLVADIDGNVIEGYYDFDYEPETPFKLSFTLGEDFYVGHYYDTDNKKHVGEIKFPANGKYIEFKNHLGLKSKIKPEDCKAYVIGVDSFAVIKDFYYQRGLKLSHSEDPDYVKVMKEIDDLVFYKHTKVTNQNIFESYIVKRENKYFTFKKDLSRFIRAAKDIFAKDKDLVKSIEDAKFEMKDFPSLLKMYEYGKLYKQNKKVYFNSYWDEIDDLENEDYAYYANIVDIKDGVYTLKYFFKNDVPLFQGSFTSFYPHQREGDFIYYTPDGNIRKQIRHIDDKKKEETTFYINGNVKTVSVIGKHSKKYSVVNDENGENVLNDKGYGAISYNDIITGRRLKLQFKQHILSNIYFKNDNNEYIYILSEKNAKLKGFKSLTNKFYMEEEYPSIALRKYGHGLVLVKFLIDKKGVPLDYEIIKSLSPEFDNLVKKFIKSGTASNSWKPAVANGVKVKQEIVVPFKFSINGFSKYRGNNYYDFFWMQQNWHMQQMQQVPINVPNFRIP